jgi:hypothetical protein
MTDAPQWYAFSCSLRTLRGEFDQMTTVETDGADAELSYLREQLVSTLSGPVVLHESATTLNYADRRGSDQRMMKYLHQMCEPHRQHFVHMNQVKLLYLIDAFRVLASAENSIALYGVARTVFELSALLHEVQTRLENARLKVNDKTWLPLGEKFFGLIVRARFATTHPEYHKLLLADGVPARRLEPYNITHCVKGLSSSPEHQDAVERYALLCDFVHHNLGSSTTANTGSGITDVLLAPSGGAIYSSKGPFTVTRYEYPAAGRIDRALDELALGFLRDVQACLFWLVRTPPSPFPEELLLRVTGNRYGMAVIDPR